MSKHFGRLSDGSHSFPPVWSARQRAVCFVLGSTGATCVIAREALELLEGRAPLGAADCLAAYRRHRRWIEELAAAEIADTPTGDMVLTAAHVRFQLACENTDLPDVLCV
jgi:hypothetical protein